MGKRKKSARKPMGPKKREGLSTTFKCLFCNNENSISVKIDKKAGTGTVACRDCGISWQTGGTTNLTQPVDIYCEWIDACEDVATKEVSGDRNAQISSRPQIGQRAGLAPGESYTAEDAGFIDDEGVDEEADYADDD